MNRNKCTKLPPITVLMATYNDERFIGEAVKSILSQTMSEFEFIIIDDASTDRTPIILSEFGEQDSRIRVIRNPKNLGLTKSLNIGLENARGQFIARIDGDDISHIERLESQYKYMIDNPHCHFLATEGVLIGESGKKIKNIRIHFNNLSQTEYILNYGSPFVHSSMMFSKQKVLELGGYDENYKTRQDLVLYLKVLSAGYSINVLHRDLIAFRMHDKSVSTTSTDNLYLNIAIRFLFKLKNKGYCLGDREALSFVKNDFWSKYFVQHILFRKMTKDLISKIKSGYILLSMLKAIHMMMRIEYIIPFKMGFILNKLINRYEKQNS